MSTFRRTFLYGLLLAYLCAFCQSAPAQTAGRDLGGASSDWRVTYTSPKTGATQGYATDGANHYLFSTASLQEDDAQWTMIYSNSSPFGGLPQGVTHVGDGDYYHGKLYAPVEQFASCDNFSHQTIVVYSAHTKDLPLSTYADISANRHEVSSVTIVPSTNSLYVSSFCDGSRLWIYDVNTLALKGTLELSESIQRIQGISWSSARHQFAVTSDDPSMTTGYIYLVSSTGKVTGPVYTPPQRGELEGVDYTQGAIRYLIGGYVYFLAGPANSGQGRPQIDDHK